MTSSSSGTRSSADRRVDAVRQNASRLRLRRRSWSEVNFVGRVKSTARIRRRRWGAGASSGSRPSRAASTSAAIASALRTSPALAHAASLHYAGAREYLGVLAAGLPDRHLPVADVDADRATAVAAGRRGEHGNAQAARALAHCRLVALADVEARRRDGEHLRAADQHGLEARAARAERFELARAAPARRCRRTCAGCPCASPGACGSTTCASAARCRARRSISARPMHEPSPSDTSTWPGALDAASSPIRTMVSERVHQPPARGARAALHAALVGDEQEARSSSPRPRR